MNTVSFDPQNFLDAITTEALERSPPIPAGTELIATITDLQQNDWQSRDGTKSGKKFDVQLEAQTTPQLQQQGIPPVVRMKDSIMLDLTDGGSLDLGPGRNFRLRIYREATGLNQKGQPFSARMLVGRQIKIVIKHRIGNDQQIYSEVGAVTAP